VLAAGGIVLRREQPPRIAVVRLRKRDEWVLPKGKLDDGETPRAAAKREVLEETGHNVTVHEFLGTLVYDSGGRSKVVHYWSMEAGFEPSRELMSDVTAVDWLPLNAALERLSRGYERVFLESVGPLAVNAMSRRLKAKANEKANEAKSTEPKLAAARLPAARKRRDRVEVTPRPVFAAPPPAQIEPAPRPPEFEQPMAATEASPCATSEVMNGESRPEAEIAGCAIEAECWEAVVPDDSGGDAVNLGDAPAPANQRRSFAERLREWFGRAA
jgi:8-oxo-dGTP diphosphatase